MRARELLREEGCDNFTLAKHMECSLIAFYSYLRNKGRLLATFSQEVVENVLELNPKYVERVSRVIELLQGKWPATNWES